MRNTVKQMVSKMFGKVTDNKRVTEATYLILLGSTLITSVQPVSYIAVIAVHFTLITQGGSLIKENHWCNNLLTSVGNSTKPCDQDINKTILTTLCT